MLNQKSYSIHCCLSLNSQISCCKKAIAESDCSGHYAWLQADCKNIIPAGNNSISVTLPNGHTIQSTHIGLLPFTNLPHKARIVYLFPALKKILISLGQLCEAVMVIKLTNAKIFVFDKTTQELVLDRDLLEIDKM